MSFSPNAAPVLLIDYDLWILSVYCPPSYSLHENEVFVLVILNFGEGHEVVVFGDFNLPCCGQLVVECLGL